VLGTLRVRGGILRDWYLGRLVILSDNNRDDEGLRGRLGDLLWGLEYDLGLLNNLGLR
jgi:hypothetical protein